MNSLRSYLEQKKKRVALFAVLFFLFIGSVALPAVGILQVNMFPASDEDTFWINVELPIGSPLSTTDVVLQQVEAELLDDERILSFSANVGQSSNAGSVESGTQSDTHLGYIVVNLNPEREERSTDIVAQYEQELAGLINGVHIEVIQQSSGPEDSAPVEIRVIGEDLLILEDMATAIETQLKQVPGTKNVDTTIQQTNGELVVDIDRNQAQLYGVSPQDIAGLLRGALVGTDATTLRTAGDDVDVRVEYTLGQSFDERSLSPNQINISDIESLTILTQKGEVPLKNLASIRLAHNRARVSHLDGNRVIRINSQVETGTTAQQVFLAAQAFVDDMYIPDGYVIEMGGEREDINESFADMFRAFILAIFMIGALLVLQFKSYRQPLFILVTIPLSLIGVLPGLVLMNQPLSFPGIIGVVALAGIVVNNAIILIDRMNLNVREKGHDLNHAIEQAAGSRLQPILLTTITTVSGILPLAMSDPVWGPLGYSIVFGLLFSTVTTLFVVPMLYQRYSDFSKKQRMQKKKKMGFLQGVSK